MTNPQRAGPRGQCQPIATRSNAIDLDPKHIRAYTNRGMAYAAKDDYDSGIADFSKAIELDPKSVSAYTCRGLAYAAKGDYVRAIADFTKAAVIK